MPRDRAICALLVLFLASAPASAQPRIDPAGIGGAVLLCGRGDISQAALEQFVALAGAKQAKIVFLEAGEDKLPPLPLIPFATKNGITASVVRIKDAKDALKSATGIWFHVGASDLWRAELQKHPIAADCQALLQRGGVVGAAGVGTEIFADALKLVPDAMVDAPAESSLTTLAQRMKSLPGSVGFSIEPGAALLLQGRTLSAIGKGSIDIHVAKSKTLPVRTIKMQGNSQEDLTALRRAARDRAEGFPPTKPEPPVLDKGTLVIVGGGGSPKGLYPKFVEYAGGPDKAHIVIFPTAAADPLPRRDSLAATFKKAGAKKVTILYGKTQKEVESKEFLETLKEATGLWFDGGRQWRFVDAYENTKALPLMFDVLKRGGVIGGTSAGATIQGDYLARGGVFNNFAIRYEGYERGLGFLKGVAIDQHFTQRKRQADMTKLMKIYPQYLGIGIDEATALVVQGQTAQIIGNGKVHFYDMNRKSEKGQPDYEAVPAGGWYDLKERRVLPHESR